MKDVFQAFSLIVCCSIATSVYATQSKTQDHTIREMTRDEVLISSHTETSPDVIGGVIEHPKYTHPKPSNYDSNVASRDH